ncbi:DUF3784 domain-containing protein [Alkalihalobacterium chitinilyticum]|uniref:DUF3784 domain-containing protein n=1 Tax=Alkalihalobacterium chitinilyticum TaxID=2980103 RepID=A0ABT5VCM6_9BACI|nr:DUF3784 domain-containing protein [Alkalihalobacterium chitinilyticum]MDE5413199.1 DUF3784 domain-containing protein [Alkalihalobacterium chitinilyticum]
MTHFVTGLFFILLGYLIKYKQWSWLIAGYNTSSKEEKATYDKQALCNGVGNFIFLLSGLLFITGLGEFLNMTWITKYSWIIAIIAIILFLIYANTGNRFKK